jgi:DNA-binding NtrC family response regulator
MNHHMNELSSETADQLLRYAWPGNVRELANAMERAAAVAKNNLVELADLPPEVSLILPVVPNRRAQRFLRDVEKECILNALEKTGGNRIKAAEFLDIGVATLYRRLNSYNRELIKGSGVKVEKLKATSL